MLGSQEPVRLNERRHGIVLARPFAQALALALGGAVLVGLGWPVSPVGALALAAGALVALRAAWRWERTRLVVTSDKLLLVSGTVRRRVSSVALERLDHVRIEQSLLGRLLGYGTLVAGELEIDYVPRPGEVSRLLR
jgi:uncharacterized membrane protein YdbT with pleckstrin-like domain